jgi:NDP-sugar pyrophosphorylase family protein
MPQLINELLADGQRVGSFPVHEFWLDVGTHRQYNEAQIRFTGGAPVER